MTAVPNPYYEKTFIDEMSDAERDAFYAEMARQKPWAGPVYGLIALLAAHPGTLAFLASSLAVGNTLAVTLFFGAIFFYCDRRYMKRTILNALSDKEYVRHIVEGRFILGPPQTAVNYYFYRPLYFGMIPIFAAQLFFIFF